MANIGKFDRIYVKKLENNGSKIESKELLAYLQDYQSFSDLEIPHKKWIVSQIQHFNSSELFIVNEEADLLGLNPAEKDSALVLNGNKFFIFASGNWNRINGDDAEKENLVLISGDITYSGLGMDFDYTNLVYEKNGNQSTISGGVITLDVGDSDDRFDIIYIDTVNNVVGVHKGTPDQNPSIPYTLLDSENELILGIYFIKANAVTPDFDIENIYDENTEWTFSIAQQTGNNTVINPDYATDPKEGGKSLLMSYGAGFAYLTAKFTPIQNEITTDTSKLVFWVKFNEPLEHESYLTLEVHMPLNNMYQLKAFTVLTRSLTVVDDNITGWQKVIFPLKDLRLKEIDFVQFSLTGEVSGSVQIDNVFILDDGQITPDQNNRISIFESSDNFPTAYKTAEVKDFNFRSNNQIILAANTDPDDSKRVKVVGLLHPDITNKLDLIGDVEESIWSFVVGNPSFGNGDLNLALRFRDANDILKVDWGDGVTDSNTSHTYSNAGEYIVKIYPKDGKYVDFYWNGTGDCNKLKEGIHWGRYMASDYGLYRCKKLNLPRITGKPTFSSSASYFLSTEAWVLTDINGIEDWDVTPLSEIKLIADNYALTLEGRNLGKWDVRNATAINITDCRSLNADISGWRLSPAITNMRYFFNRHLRLQANLSRWDMSHVTIMESMFKNFSGGGAENILNPDISGWDVSNNTDFMDFLYNQASFNQPLNSWNVGNVTRMQNMFWGNKKFNQPLNSWNTSNVTNMESMFQWAESFNQPLNSWNVSSVTNFRTMFWNAYSFNQDLSNWQINTEPGVKVNMYGMFSKAWAFTQDISMWDFTNVTNLDYFITKRDGEPDNVPYPPEYYGKLLKNWSENATLKARKLTVKMTDVKYDASYESYRQDLIDAGWTITDGGIYISEKDEENCSIWEFVLEAGDLDLSLEIRVPAMIKFVDWGDGRIDNTLSHTYSIAGKYTVKLYADELPNNYIEFFWNNTGDKDKLYKGIKWGRFKLWNRAFEGCNNLDLSKIEGTPRSFALLCNTAFRMRTDSLDNQKNAYINHIENWNFTKASTTNISYFFRDLTTFNQNIGGWEVGGVTSMNGVFENCTSFNQDISSWDFTSVISLASFMHGKGEEYNPIFYGKLLKNWAENTTLRARGLTANMGSIKYDPAYQTYKDDLINTYGWTITDGGAYTPPSGGDPNIYQTIDLSEINYTEAIFAGFDMKINAIDKVYEANVGDSFDIEVNGSAYSLGTTITKGDKIEFSTDGAVVYTIEIEKL